MFPTPDYPFAEDKGMWSCPHIIRDKKEKRIQLNECPHFGWELVWCYVLDLG